MKIYKSLLYVYIVFFLFIVFAGSEGIFIYATEMMALSSLLLIIGRCMNKREFGIAIDKKIIFLYILLLLFMILDYSFWTIYKTSTKAYVERYLCYLPVILITIKPKVIIKIIDVSKNYLLIISIVFVLKYPFLGVNGSFLGSYQNVASALSIGLLFYISDILYDEILLKKNLAFFIITMGTLFMTGKRTFTVIPFAILIVFTLLKKRKDNKKRVINRIITIIFISIIIGTVVFIFAPDLLLVFNRLAEAGEQGDMNGRKGFWNLAIYLWENNKIIGIGMGTFQDFISNNTEFTFEAFRVQEAYSAHNIYYQMLAEVGTVGFVIFLVFFINNILTTISELKSKKVKENANYYKILHIAMFIQIWFLLYGFTGNPLYMNNQFYVYLFSIMMVQSVKREIRYCNEKI